MLSGASEKPLRKITNSLPSSMAVSVGQALKYKRLSENMAKETSVTSVLEEIGVTMSIA